MQSWIRLQFGVDICVVFTADAVATDEFNNLFDSAISALRLRDQPGLVVHSRQP